MSSKKSKLPINIKNARFQKLQRQTNIAKILSKNPHVTHADIAEMLGVSQTTVNKDVGEINRALHNETMISAFIHRNRVLQEIAKKKQLCSERLAQFVDPSKGTRWIEEWTKLLEKECKILGIYSPDRKIVAHIDSGRFTKEEKDAAIKAALLVEDVIDVGKN